jgi:putative secretion ATPase (PEP-CTERM system associated)
MYDDHYGLSGRPFQLTPDPRFWFDTATHRKAMAYLGYGLAQGEGFIVITGDVGAGKTTLVGHLMATVDRERLHIIKIVSTQIEAEDLLRMVAGGLEVESGGMTKAQLLVAIERALHAMARSGRRTLLIVDEAQALPVSALEELRMLSNFQAGGHALLQIFLLGQPEFRQRLHGSDRLEQLRQRVIAMHHLDPMGPEEVEPYMLHRLSVVGWEGRPRFTPDAFAALYKASDGVPRRLNQLAGRVLLFGAIDQLDTIDARVVAAVIDDIASDSPAPKPAPRAAAPVAEPVAPMPITAAVASNEPRPIRAFPEAPEFNEADRLRPERRSGSDRRSMQSPRAERPVERPDAELTGRIAALEARIDEQDAALRRVLTLLVDWVEGDQRPDLASIRAASR